MIQEALKYVAELSAPNYHDVNGREYSDRPLHPIQLAVAEHRVSRTLSGFVEMLDHAINDFPADGSLVHVVSEKKVALISVGFDEWNRRQTFATAELIETRAFSMGSFLDHESFIIGLQSQFDETPDREYLLRLASNITTERVKTSMDDGISQTLGQKTGVALKAEVTAKTRVLLAPFRTFHEVAQPSSEFVFRAKQDGDGVPRLALFDADGGAWMLDAMKSIGEYLRSKTTLPVIV